MPTIMSKYIKIGILEAVASNNGSEIRDALKYLKNGNLRDSDGKTLVMLAAESGNAKLIRSLAEMHADIGARDVNHLDALWYALVNNNIDAAKTLVSLGADITTTDAYRKIPALHGAAQSGAVDTIKYLLENSHDPNMISRVGTTPLHHAARHAKVASISILLDAGADPLKRDGQGISVIDDIVTRIDVASIHALENHNIDVDQPGPKGRTPLDRLINLKSAKTSSAPYLKDEAIEMAKYLIRMGASIEKIDRKHVPQQVISILEKIKIEQSVSAKTNKNNMESTLGL